jgi:hypothetical protein
MMMVMVTIEMAIVMKMETIDNMVVMETVVVEKVR